MLGILLGITTRIISNSYLNVFQKILTNLGNTSSIVNFWTYLGLCIISLCILPFVHIHFSIFLLRSFLIMGILGALGNYFIIKALSIGELSTLAPINSYKPIIAMFIAFIYLNEVPSLIAVFGILLIIFGTIVLYTAKSKFISKAVFYRSLALIFSGAEAVFIKKIILLTDVTTSFVLWCFAGLIFSFGLILANKKKSPDKSGLKYLILLIIAVGIMQFSTNFVFSKINVSYALAIFQLSTILSVFLGVNIFKEKDLTRKIVASLIMIFGAILIILN